jgi:outer membrane protein with beta-barrel domain
MRGVIAAVIVACALVPAGADAGSLELRVGGFYPKADSLRFKDDEELFGTRKDDWRGGTGALEYAWNAGRSSELGLHLDGFGRTVNAAYRNYHRQRGGDILLDLELKTASLGMSYRYLFGRRHARFKPYVGLGADVVFWEYKEVGSRVDFGDCDRIGCEIIEFDEAFADGAVPAAHVMAGLRFGITPDIYLTAEAKYLATATDEMKDDFGRVPLDVAPNEINLSGSSATIGIMIRFD